jgi:hypothetical protein
VGEREYGSPASYAVDTEASLVILNHFSVVRGRMSELGMGGCRLRADRPAALPRRAPVEVMFKINGTGFRLPGTIEWGAANPGAAVHFGALTPRNFEALRDALAELDPNSPAASHAPQTPQAPHMPPAPAVSQPPRQSLDAAFVSLLGWWRRIADRRRNKSQKQESNPVKADQPVFPSGSTPVIPAPPACPPQAQATAAAHPSPATGRDRRAQSRHTVDTRASLFFIDVRAQITGRIVDLSIGGCRIRTDERFPVGIYRRVEAEFNLDGLPFRLGGVVQAVHDRRTVGIRFIDMSPRKREHLTELMEEIAEMKKAAGEGMGEPGNGDEGEGNSPPAVIATGNG